MGYDFLTYREKTTTAIHFNNVIEHLKKEFPEVILIFNDKYNTNTFTVFIPLYSVNPIYYECSISQNFSCLHDIRLLYPCSITDLKIFNCLCKYFQNQFKINENAFYEHNHYNKVFYGSIVALLNSTDIEIGWQNLMNSVFKNDESEYCFPASNNVLKFYLSANFLGVSKYVKNFNQSIIDATLKYIWQNKFIDVNSIYNCMMVHHHNNKMWDSVIETNIWENKQVQDINIYYYLLVEFNKEWIAIKPKNWLPILLPYLQKYDLGMAKLLMPVIDNADYLQILKELSVSSVNLKFSHKEKDGKKELFASVKKF